MSSKTEAWSSAQLREKLENSKLEELKGLRDAGLLDQEVIDFLIEFQEYYRQEENRPYYAHNTDTWNRIITKNASKNLQRAIRQGDVDTINHFLGVVDRESDVSGVRVYERFSRWVTRTAGTDHHN